MGLRDYGTSGQGTADWHKAIGLAKQHAQLYASKISLSDRWRAAVRVCTMSHAIQALRRYGFNIDLPESGGVEINDAVSGRLAAEIDRLSRVLGNALSSNALHAIRGVYSQSLHRFHLGRDGRTTIIDAQAQVPWAYLYQLGLRYFDDAPSGEGAADYEKLKNLTAAGVALHDVVLDSFELVYARPVDIVQIAQRSLVYDSFFQLAQADPTHVIQFLDAVLTHPSFSSLQGKRPNETSQEVLAVARNLLHMCQRVEPDQFSMMLPKGAQDNSGLLWDVFTHAKGANQKLTFPPKDTAVDAAFRPLLVQGEALVMQPPSLAARAVLNACLDWCRCNWGSKGNFDETLGKVFEEFVRGALTAKGVQVSYGSYSASATEGECDAVVESDSAVIFFELKGKVLNRISRSGDDVKALSDLADSMVRPQAQAMARHAFLTQHRSMELTGPSGTSRIELAGREVFKISVTRGELWSLHDRPFLQHFLRAGCLSRFTATDSSRQGELEGLHDRFSKLKTTAALAGERLDVSFPFETSWSLSVFQLLLLLQRSTDANSFVKEL